MDVTIRFESVLGEYHARRGGRVIGFCHPLPEHGKEDQWKWSVKDTGEVGFAERETALLQLHAACVAKDVKAAA